MHDTTTRVLLAIAAAPGVTANELRDGLGMALVTVHEHLRRLRAAGVIQRAKHGRYTVKPARHARAPAGAPLAKMMAKYIAEFRRAFPDAPIEAISPGLNETCVAIERRIAQLETADA